MIARATVGFLDFVPGSVYEVDADEPVIAKALESGMLVPAVDPAETAPLKRAPRSRPDREFVGYLNQSLNYRPPR